MNSSAKEVAEDYTVSLAKESSTNEVLHHNNEYLFELSSLGPADILARCKESPGNWWGDEDSLRVDEQGRVVLVDANIYFEVRVW